MAEANTADEAVQRWLQEDSEALEVAQLDLQLQRSNKVGLGNATVFAHQQFIDGLPVENGFTRILVSSGSSNQVVYVGARLAQFPEGGFQPDTVSAVEALTSVQQSPAYADLTQWSEPEMVIFYGDEELIQPIRAWKFRGSHSDDLTLPESYRFFVDAATGELVNVRNEICHTDVYGHVSSMATPGLLPDVVYNPADEEMDMRSLRVQLLGGDPFAYTDEDGDYFFTCDPPCTNVEVYLVGQWVTVNDIFGRDLHLQHNLPSPVDFLFNSAPAQLSTAQVNAYIHVTLVHDFYKVRQPDFGELDLSIDCIVNRDFCCQGLYDGGTMTLRFCWAHDGCVNTAYSSIVAHEYGHFINDRLQISYAGAFGEGFSDTVAILVYDDPIIARDITGPCTFWRDIENANIQYPCSGVIHYCGQLLAGVWWDIKLNIQDAHPQGQQEGLAYTRQLFTDWSRIMTGGLDGQAAHPVTLVQVLTADDCYGNPDPECTVNYDDLTPYWREICDAFAAHNIPCPIADCNNNGINDELDISSGTSQDCQPNGIPDECPRQVCTTNEDCDDGDPCNGDEYCDPAGCCQLDGEREEVCPQDDFFCNGPEICVPFIGCMSSGDPCAPQYICDEENDECVFCQGDPDCDDGLFCNGIETCTGGGPALCKAGIQPCGCQLCNEFTDLCVDCLSSADCDDGDACTIDLCLVGVCSNDLIDCDDDDCCTHDACNDGNCQNTPLATGEQCKMGDNCYGDVDGNNDINLIDLMAMLDGISGLCLINGWDPEICANLDIKPCAGNDEIDLMDFLAMLDALAGFPTECN